VQDVSKLCCPFRQVTQTSKVEAPQAKHMEGKGSYEDGYSYPHYSIEHELTASSHKFILDMALYKVIIKTSLVTARNRK